MILSLMRSLVFVLSRLRGDVAEMRPCNAGKLLLFSVVAIMLKRLHANSIYYYWKWCSLRGGGGILHVITLHLQHFPFSTQNGPKPQQSNTLKSTTAWSATSRAPSICLFSRLCCRDAQS